MKKMLMKRAILIATTMRDNNNHIIMVMTKVPTSWIHMVIDITTSKDKINKYECRTGPFEGFFVSSVEFCDAKNKFNDDNKVKIFPPPGILTAEFWQWVTEIPREINPLLDKTGDNCDVNQQGPVWFLVGTPGDTEAGNLTTGSAERDCIIPEEKKILIPIINAACLELTDQHYSVLKHNWKKH